MGACAGEAVAEGENWNLKSSREAGEEAEEGAAVDGEGREATRSGKRRRRRRELKGARVFVRHI